MVPDLQTNLKPARKAKNLSIRQLQDRTGINRGELSKMERGITLPSQAEADQIEGVLGEPILYWVPIKLR
jgi:transcriptional regulator with XRE-family HTH domain